MNRESRRAPAIAAILVASALAVVAAGSPTMLQPTAAAWTGAANAVSAVSSGTWLQPIDPIVVDNDDTVVDAVQWQLAATAADAFCVQITVTGATATPQPWALLVDLGGAPFYGATAGQVISQGSSQVVVAAAAGMPGFARVTGSSNPGNPWNPDWNNALLTSSQTITIKLCDYTPRNPSPGDQDWYSVSTSHGTWTPTQACVILTVTATVDGAYNPFYFGWQAQLDLTAAKNEIVSNGRTVNYVGWSPYPSAGYQYTTSPTTYLPVADAYSLASGFMTAIRAGGSTSITACVYGY